MVPGGRAARVRSSALVAACSVGYLALAAAVCLYVLPVGWGVDGVELLAAQCAVVAFGAGAVAWTAISIRRHARRRGMLAAVTHDAGWTYRDDVSDWIWGGSLDEQIERSGRTARDHLDARRSAVPFDSAEHTYVVGYGEGSTIHSIRSVRIPLPAEAPRITLRSRSGRGALSTLPRRGAQLRLEGDFSDVFELSVPSGYETDALYVLTPDLMATLMDASSDLDLEVVDSSLYVYFPAVDLTDADQLARFVSVIAALHDRFGRRTLLYRDDNAPSLDAAAYRRSGDMLAASARVIDSRVRISPVVVAVLAPLVPLVIAIVLTRFV
ncbi:hypothetical protein [Microbacterium sp. CGR1]|uniref:hypothetical protein n=1 Tax=Microbacterium sp. CGR1 TaxID=1696072 RepID=UPI003DA48E78